MLEGREWDGGDQETDNEEDRGALGEGSAFAGARMPGERRGNCGVRQRGRSSGGEVRKGSGEDGREWGSSWRGNAALEREVELEERMAARQSGGGGDGGLRRRRRLEDCSVAMIAEKNPWSGQGVAAVVAAAAAAVGLLPRPSLSSHLRGRSLLSFFK